MQRIPIQRTKGRNEFSDTTFAMLNALAERKLSGKKARAFIEKLINNSTVETYYLLKRILKKDLRAGISATTINNAIPKLIPIFEVMLAQPVDWGRAYWPCYISPKIDGVRGVHLKKTMRSRKGHKLLGFNHIIEEVCDLGGYMTDGEIIVPNHLFDDSSGLIRNHKPVPTATYHIFDLPQLNAPFYARYAALEGMFSNGEKVHFVPHYVVDNKQEALGMYKQFIKEGYEGAVLKYYDTDYKRGRYYNWMKIVPEETIDAVVISIIEGNGKFRGMMGSVLCKDEQGAFVRVSNRFTDEQRQKYFNHPELIEGRTIELILKERSKFGRLRSGRWNGRFRDDK